MGAQPPVRVPSGIALTDHGSVGPTTPVEVKSLGVGTAAPGTTGYVKATVYDLVTFTGGAGSANITRGATGWVYIEAGGGDGVKVRPSPGLTNGEVDLGYGVAVYPSAGGAVLSYMGATGRIVAGNGFGTHTPTVKTLTFASGVAQEVTATRDMTVHLQLDTTVAGHVTVTMGSAAGGTTHVVATALAILAGADALLTIHVPMTWKLVVTVTTATIKSALAVS
jgi:hypothetical protein